MSNKSGIWYIQNINLSELFCPVLLSSPEMSHTTKSYKKNEFIYFPNEIAGKIYFIEKGRVKIGAYSDDGKEIIKTILNSNELFGELGLLGEQTRSEFAQAMETTNVCILSVENVHYLMAQNKDFSLHITRLIGNKLIKTQRRLESLVFKDARGRVIEFLRDLAHEHGQRVGYETVVRQFFTHQEIANLTGTSRQTVTTILNELRAENLIYFNRRKLLIRDLKKLETMSV